MTLKERLHESGPESLSLPELLAVITRSRNPGSLPERQADQDLPAYLHHLATQVSPAQAATLKAALDLSRRLAANRIGIKRRKLNQPKHMVTYITQTHPVCHQMQFGAVYLDNQRRLIKSEIVFKGSFDRAKVTPGVLLANALALKVPKITTWSTHPSGYSSPSPQDTAFQGRLVEACAIVGIELIDHLVIGSSADYVSFRRRGSW